MSFKIGDCIRINTTYWENKYIKITDITKSRYVGDVYRDGVFTRTDSYVKFDISPNVRWVLVKSRIKNYPKEKL